MLKKLFSLLIFYLALTLTVTPTHAQAPLAAPEVIAGEVLVKFKPQLTAQGVPQLHLLAGATLLESAPQGGWLRLRVEPGREAEMIAHLQARGDVAAATPNYQVYAVGSPNDLDFAQQWGLNNTGQTGGSPDADIDAPEAWDIYAGSDNVTVAVIDTGVDLDHPDLQANLVTGYNFVNNTTLADDDNSHGTHAAGISAAVGNNALGVSGVSWRAKIMPLKILTAQGSGSLFDLAQAIYYATDNGAKVINMSLGATCSGVDWSSVTDAVDYAVGQGVLLVASAGNSGTNTVLCPAGLEGVLAVGASNSLDQRWGGSNYGSGLAVVAPGDTIYSTTPGGSYGYKTGTSMSGPYVAGLAALVWSLNPAMTADQLQEIILTTSDDLGDPGWDPYFGYGRINAWRAVDAASLQLPETQTIFLSAEILSTNSLISLTAAHPNPITWTTTISPAVSWLNLASPSSGTISALSSPANLSVVATQPLTYGTYTTTLVTTATVNGAVPLLPRHTEIRLIYGPIYRMYFPLIFK